MCVHAYLFRKIDSLLMLRAAMRLPWLIAECCCVHVRASVWLSVCGWDWQSPYRLRASCREQSTGIILHSRPKHLNTQSSNSPKSDKAEADIGTSMSVCVCVCVSAHTHVGLVPMGKKPPQAPLTCNPSHFPAETALLPAPPPRLPPVGGGFEAGAERVYLHPKSPGYVIVCDPAGGREREKRG